MRDITQLVIAQGMKPTGIGVLCGLVVAFALGGVVQSMVYGVSARDVATFLVVSVVLIAVGFFASLIPAYRATRIQPLAVLRDE